MNLEQNYQSFKQWSSHSRAGNNKSR